MSETQIVGAAPAGRRVDLAEAAGLLAGCRSAVILTHRSPDGDCIGSATALASALHRLGKRAWVCCPDLLPAYLLKVPGAGEIVNIVPIGEWDLLVSVDVSDTALLRPLPAAVPEYFSSRPSLNVDHHASNLLFARDNYVDSGVSAAAELVYRLLRELDVPLDKQLAQQLLYGIVNDTHSFQNANVTPMTLRIAADLVEAGGDLQGITFDLLIAKEPPAARLWSQVLPTLTFAEDGKVALATVTQAALAAAGATLVDADGLVEFLRSIRGVDLAVLIKQTGPESYRLSTRTTEAVDAVLVTAPFGGGGHRRAAGGDAQGTLDSVIARVLASYIDARQRTDG